MSMVDRFAFVLIFFPCLAACNQVDNNTRLSNQNTSLDMTTSGQTTSLKFLALGDSYTIGESVPEEDRWPVVLANKLTVSGLPVEKPEIIATTGWTTDELKKGIKEASPKGKYDLVSLLIGVNNQYRGYEMAVYEEEFQELLDVAIAFADNNPSRVFVVSIPDYAVTPFGLDKDPEKITREIDQYNKINRSLAERSSVRYFNITGISRQASTDPELVAGDGLHPSGKMYHQWVDHILLGVKEMPR
ncbi:MAG: SGNH/GDSL hydrolase family protein [Cytophagales bacterium]|nr:SGNH/GDSL hydrolase family protein [Cytophagales bacterium]